MKKNLSIFSRKIISIILIALTIFVSIPVSGFAQTEPEATTLAEVDTVATNPLGDVLKNAINEEKESEGSLYKISDIELNGFKANVRLFCSGPCTVLVSVYDEQTNRMITSGMCGVDADTTSVEVELEKCELPEYYIIKGYILDNENKPLSDVYENSDHTFRMVDFFSKTIYDFDSDYVLNIDSSIDNNFVVVTDSAKIIETSASTNTIVTNDYKNGIYVFDNIDSTLKNLHTDDIIFVRTGSGAEDFILAKATDVDVEGSRVTIKTEKTSNPDDLFSFIKINTDYLGAAARSNEDSSEKIKIPTELKFEISSDKENDKHVVDTKVGTKYDISFRLFGDITIDFEYYRDTKNDVNACEYTATYNVGGEFNVDVGGTIAVTFRGDVESPPTPYGLQAFVEISLKIELTAQLTVTGNLTYTGVEGYRKELCSSRGIDKKEVLGQEPQLKVEFEQKVEAFIKITLTAKVGIQFIKILKAYIQGQAIFEIKTELFELEVSSDRIGVSFPFLPWTEISIPEPLKHECAICLEFDINLILSVGIVLEASLDELETDTIDLSVDFSLISLEKTIPLGKFRGSIYKGDWEWQKLKTDVCPHCEYLVSFLSVSPEENNLPIEGTIVTITPEKLEEDNKFYNEDAPKETIITTDSSGVATAYLPVSIYNYTVSNSNYEYYKTAEKPSVIVEDGPEDALLNMEKLHRVTVNVTDTENNVLQYVGVSCDDLSTDNTLSIRNATTDENGQASVRVTRGDYKFIATISSDGRSAEMEVSVTEDTEINLAIDKGNTITVTVLSTGGIPIEGAVVNNTIKTDVNGQAKFVLDKGTHDISATFNGETTTESVTVEGNPVSVEITLDVGYRVTFIAKSKNGAFIPGVIISGNLKTDKNGKAVKWMKNGDYTISVKNSNMVDTESFTVNGEDLTVEFILNSEISYTYSGNTLVISGYGDMPDYLPYSASFAPWHGRRNYTHNVIIEEGITSISSGAFYEFINLEKITIASSVKSVSKNAFTHGKFDFFKDGCFDGWVAYPSVTDGTYIVNSDFVNFTSYAFDDDSSLEYISLPDKINYIPEGLFFGCSNLSSVVIPDTVTSIGCKAFMNCTKLESITIPDGVTRIEDEAFSGCTNLKEIIIPDSVEYIGSGAFSGCTNLVSITIPDSVTEIGKNAFSDCERLEKINIPENVASIGNNAFKGCYNLSVICWETNLNQELSSDSKIFVDAGISAESMEVVFGDNVTQIPQYLFYDCDGLTKVVVDKNIQNVGKNAFAECDKLKEVYWNIVINSSTANYIFRNSGVNEGIHIVFGDDIDKVSKSLFALSKVKSIDFGSGVKEICENAFIGCTGLTDVVLPKNINSIATGAFSDCTDLVSITVPEELKYFSYNVLKGCTSLEKVYWNVISADFINSGNYSYKYNFLGDLSPEVIFGDNVTVIPEGLFTSNTSLTEITIPEQIKTIDQRAFYNCDGLTLVSVSENLTTIGTYAFYSCDNLKFFSIPKSLTVLNEFVFAYCNFEDIVIPDNVKMIDSCAFEGNKVKNLSLPVSTEVESLAFFNCRFIETVIFTGKGNMQDFSSEGLWYYSKCNLKEVVIEEGVSSIGEYAFYNCKNISEITIPKSIVSIGTGAFAYCDGIEEIVIPTNVEILNTGAFNYCKNLKKLTVHGTLKYGSGAFSFASALETVIIEADMADATIVNSKAPWKQNKVKNIIIQEGIESIDSVSFADCSSLISVDLPDSLIEINDRAFEGCIGLKKIDLPINLKKIGYGAFEACSGLTSINLPDKLESIGYYAFSDCTGFTKITIPESVKSIEQYAFAGCTGLTEVTIPEKITSVEPSIFKYCDNLQTVYWNAINASNEFELYSPIGVDAEIILGENVERITAGLFCNRDYLTSIVLPEKVKYIDSCAFYNCKNLKNIVIPESVIEINERAFYGCNGFDNIKIPKNVSYIGDRAFYDCLNVTELLWDSIECELGSDVFSGLGSNTNGATVTFGANVKSIPPRILQHNSYADNILNVKNIVIGLNVKSISNYSFDSCAYLENVYWNAIACNDFAPDSNVFYNVAKNVDGINVIFGETVKSIPAYALGSNTYNPDHKIKSIVIGSNVESVGNRAFYNCANLEKVYWNAKTVKDAEDGSRIFYSKKTEIVFGENVEYIPVNVFNCNGINTVTIIGGIESISNGAFKHVYSLTTVNIPASVKSIGNAAFYECDNLSNINYQGSEEDWNKIRIGHSNSRLLNVTKNYNGYTPDTDQNKTIDTVESSGVFLASVKNFLRTMMLNSAETDNDSELMETFMVSESTEQENIINGDNFITVENAIAGNSYLLLIVKSDKAEDMLSADNLLYIDQKIAETDTLTFSFALREDCEDYKTVVTNAYIVVADCDKTGHSYGAFIPDTKATCLEGGTEYAVCSKCGIMCFRDAEALEHKEYVEIEGSDATCTTDGLTDKISCETCGVVLVEQQKIKGEHSYSEWQVTVQPTEETDGERQRVCSVCSETVTETVRAEPILKIGVLENAKIYTNEITFLKFVSTVSGEFSIVSESDYDIVGYLFDENMNQLAYNDDGETDADFEIVYSLAEGTTYYVGVKPYTTLYGITNGSTIGVRIVCPHTTTYERDAVEPTCTERGHTAGTACVLCNGWISGDYINMEEHSYKEWTITKQATCTEAGSKTSVCDVCGNIATMEITASHSDDNWDGTCEHCGEIFSEILIGQTIDLDIPVDEKVYIKFSPFVSGEYELKLSKLGNCNIGICNEEKNCWYSGSGGSSLSEYLEAGKTYYWRLYTYVEGPYEVSVTLDVSNAECEHVSKTSFATIDATCTADGYTAGEKCNVCTSWVSGHDLISAYGHTDENLDGVCETCNDQTGEIRVNQMVCITVESDEKVEYKCMPAYSGSYQLLLESNEPISVVICNSDRRAVYSSAASSATMKFDLNGGEEYYFIFNSYYNRPCSFNVTFTNLEIYCGHESTTNYAETESTCTESGYSEGIYCNDCENWISGHRILPLAHEDTNTDGVCEKCGRNVSDILAGETKTIEIISDEITYLKFVPSLSGVYTFTSTSDSDTYGYLFDGNKEQLAYNDDGGIGTNFSVSYSLTAGETYYWGARCYSTSKSGSFDVTLIMQESCSHVDIEEYDGIAATCTSSGYTAGRYCNDCEEWVEGHENIDQLGHNYSFIFTVDKKATCTTEGSKSKHCTRSGCTAKTSGTTIAKLGHTYTNSCDKSCNHCGATRTITHSYASATCTKAKICSVCGATSGSKLGHTYTNACDKSCNRCSATRTITHSYASATCTKAKTCKVCGATSGSKLGHTYTNSCDKSCNRCKSTRSITHAYKTTTTKATLTKSGSVKTACSVCGSVKSSKTIAYPKTFTLSTTKYTYNGSTKTPSVTVKDSTGKTLKKGTDYTVTYASGRKSVGAYKVTITMKGNYSGTKALTFYVLPSKTSKITPTATTTTLKASWNKVTGATGYKVELLNANGKVVKTVTTTKLTYTFSKLSAGTTYKIRVTAYKTISGKNQYSLSSTTLTTATKPATPTLKVTSTTKGKANLSWSNVAGETGYQVYYSTNNKTFTKIASYTTNTVKASKSKLTSGKTYYFKVRSYKKVGNTVVYGAWSSVKSVKIK